MARGIPDPNCPDKMDVIIGSKFKIREEDEFIITTTRPMKSSNGFGVIHKNTLGEKVSGGCATYAYLRRNCNYLGLEQQ